MGSTPVTLDFSKAQPLTQPGGGQSVTLDYSRAQPISVPVGSYQTRPGGPVIQPGQGREKGYSGLDDIVPVEGEAFGDTLKRAIEYGKSLTPEQLEQQRKADLKVAPMVAASAPAIGAAGAAALAGAGSAAGSAADLAAKVTARSLATSSVGTGILDAAGNEVMRDVTTYGPSLLRQFGTKAIPWVMRAAGLGGISYEVLKHLVNLAKD